MDIATLAEFFGWCTVLNLGLMIVTTIILVAARASIARVHAKLFALEEVELSQAYFRYLANYKIAVIVLNLAPYVALKIMF